MVDLPGDRQEAIQAWLFLGGTGFKTLGGMGFKTLIMYLKNQHAYIQHRI